MRTKKETLSVRHFSKVYTASAVILLLILFSAVALTGCGAKEEPEKKEVVRPDYIVGAEADNAPYYSVDEEGNESGLYVDLMESLAKNTGCTWEFQTMSATEFIAADGEDCDVFLGTMEPSAGNLSE